MINPLYPVACAHLRLTATLRGPRCRQCGVTMVHAGRIMPFVTGTGTRYYRPTALEWELLLRRLKYNERDVFEGAWQ